MRYPLFPKDHPVWTWMEELRRVSSKIPKDASLIATYCLARVNYSRAGGPKTIAEAWVLNQVDAYINGRAPGGYQGPVAYESTGKGPLTAYLETYIGEPDTMTPSEAQAALVAALEAAEAAREALAASIKAEELTKQLTYDRNLARATVGLLADVATVLNGSSASPHSTYAAFVDELQPLANKYGYRIVFVGNGEQTVLAPYAA
jgi:hypothetical protein